MPFDILGCHKYVRKRHGLFRLSLVPADCRGALQVFEYTKNYSWIGSKNVYKSLFIFYIIPFLSILSKINSFFPKFLFITAIFGLIHISYFRCK